MKSNSKYYKKGYQSGQGNKESPVENFCSGGNYGEKSGELRGDNFCGQGGYCGGQDQKKTKECGFINVTDPEMRKKLIDVSKCPGDATNFTFWFQKSDPSHWGLTIKSIPKASSAVEYERSKGMIFHSQHTWKITWYNDNGILKAAQHSKSLAEDLIEGDFQTVQKIYLLYKGK